VTGAGKAVAVSGEAAMLAGTESVSGPGSLEGLVGTSASESLVGMAVAFGGSDSVICWAVSSAAGGVSSAPEECFASAVEVGFRAAGADVVLKWVLESCHLSQQLVKLASLSLYSSAIPV
jgi:hypothetical protein